MFSARLNIEYSVSYWSILGPLVFNIDMIDLFSEFEKNGIANFADNRAPYSCSTDIPAVISELQDISTKETNPWRCIFNWLHKTILRLSHLFQISWTSALFYKSIFKTIFSFVFDITLKTYPSSVSIIY